MTYQWRKNGANVGGATSSSYTIADAQATDQASYSVKIVNGGGSVTSSNATLTVLFPPGITTQPASQAVVLGQNASFSVAASGTAPISYQWSLSGSPLAGATSSALTLTSVQTNQAGIYAVLVTNAYGAVTSINATLTVYVPPSITTQPLSQGVTQGQPVSFSVVAGGSSPFTYQWYFNGSSLGNSGGARTSTYTLYSAQNGGNYSAVVSGPGGSVTSAVALLTVYVPPTIHTQPQNQTVVQGQTASFSVEANGTAPFSYQWDFNGSAVSGATSSALALTNVQATQAGSYTVVVTNNGGSITSRVATLTVNAPPSITTQPQSQWVTQGRNVSFSVVASGTATLTYQWFFNGSSLGWTARSSTLMVNNVGTNNTGNYTVVVNNNWGSATSAVATLTLFVPPGIQTQPNNLTVTQGQNASFSVVASGTAPLNYQWNFNGTALSGATTSALTLTNVQTTGAGNYNVVVTNNAGSITSQVATLTVLVPAGITTQPQSQAVVQGQNASFSVGASGTAPLSYQWNFNGTAVSGATTSALTLTNVQTTDAGSYMVVVTNSWGSVTTAVAMLTVYVPPAVTTQPQSQAVAQDQNVSFSVVASGTSPFTYQWYFNGTPLGGGAQSSTLTLNTIGTNNGGNYTVVVNNNWGSVTSAVATLTILVPAGITTQPQSQAVVQGQNASFSVGASGTAPLNYQWNFNGTAVSGATTSALTLTNVQTTDAGSYMVVVTNSWGSVTTAVAMLTVYVPPAVTTQPQSQAVAQDQNVSFSVVASGTSPFTYQWYFNGTPLGGGAQSSTLTLNTIGTNNGGNYTVVVNNNWGSVTSAVATLTILVPAGITTQPQSQAVVQGQNASFSVGASGTAPLNYQWNFNGTAVSGATTSALTLTNVQTTDAGSYMVVVTNSWGSVTTAVAMLTVYVPPAITTQPQSQAVAQDQNVSFSVVASGTSPFTYQWYFNGTAVSDATTSALTFTNVQTTGAGSYMVVVTNNAGSITSAVATLTVTNPDVTLSLSGNAGMTPNGFTFQLSVPVGCMYVILASTDFQAWTPIATNVATTGSIVFTDTAAANYRSRFYRAIVQ
jgi:2-hydroxy-3-keto-5-methylthiopentenyl-1-phosphate phosphatase